MAWLRFDWDTTAVRLYNDCVHNYWLTAVRLQCDKARLLHDWDTTQYDYGTTTVRPSCDSPITHDIIMPISRWRNVLFRYSWLTWTIRSINSWPFWGKHEQGERNKHGHSGISNKTEKKSNEEVTIIFEWNSEISTNTYSFSNIMAHPFMNFGSRKSHSKANKMKWPRTAFSANLETQQTKLLFIRKSVFRFINKL